MSKTARRRNLHRSWDRCSICGLRTTLHFTPDNRKLSCEEAEAGHPSASVRPVSFTSQLQAVIEGAR